MDIYEEEDVLITVWGNGELKVQLEPVSDVGLFLPFVSLHSGRNKTTPFSNFSGEHYTPFHKGSLHDLITF